MNDDNIFVSDDARRTFIEILDAERREEHAWAGSGCPFKELSADRRRMINRVIMLEDQSRPADAV